MRPKPKRDEWSGKPTKNVQTTHQRRVRKVKEQAKKSKGVK